MSGAIQACSFDMGRRCWVALPEALFAPVCRAACQVGPVSAADEDSWRKMTAVLRHTIATEPPAPFAPGDVLVNIGTSWWIPDYLRYVQHAQRERGILYAPFIHDCIPLRVPDMCSASLVDEFRAWFPEAMRVADLVFANSAHTARDIVALAPKQPRGRRIEPKVVPLDASSGEGPQPSKAATHRIDASTQVRLGIRRPFALMVSTIEARKNHIFVFRCWQTLIAHMGDAVPDLLCVGKQGWLVEYTLNWLQVHPELAGRIRLLGTLPDADLAALYRSAAFTVYCSHYEGWGLPVTESLCNGRVPLLANHSSLPEAGGAFGVYFEPGSEAEFHAGVRRLLDPGERAALEARIQAEFRPRGWSDVLSQILAAARSAQPRSAAAIAAPVAELGRLYSFGRPRPGGRPPVPGTANGDAFKHGTGWWSAEDWGAWSRELEARLLFRLPARGGADLLYLVLRGGPQEQTLEFHKAGELVDSLPLPAHQRRLVRLPLDRDARGETLITLRARPYSLDPHTRGGDLREIGFGLEALSIVGRNDVAARLDVQEFLQTAA